MLKIGIKNPDYTLGMAWGRGRYFHFNFVNFSRSLEDRNFIVSNFPKNCHMVCTVPNLLGFYGTANLVSCLVAANFIVTQKLTILMCSDIYDHFMSFYDIISVEHMMAPIVTMLVTYGTTDNCSGANMVQKVA